MPWCALWNDLPIGVHRWFGGLHCITPSLPRRFHWVFLGYIQHSNKKLIAARAFCFLPRRRQASRRAPARTHTNALTHALFSQFTIGLVNPMNLIAAPFHNFCFLVWYEIMLSTSDRHLDFYSLHEVRRETVITLCAMCIQRCKIIRLRCCCCCSSKRCNYSNDRL